MFSGTLVANAGILVAISSASPIIAFFIIGILP
jgi:hypothetical protein